jgi:hypothetical protein
MTVLDVVGLGIWSSKFANWQSFTDGMRDDNWQEDAVLQPDLIPRRERRRAPQLVKMAIEVMSQACSMAGLRPNDVATVFSSAMGDMHITEYMCAALAQTPKLISPTRFHNSVHNAAPGYWSITTGSFGSASAVSAFEYTSSMALLEGVIQAVEEHIPVLIVTQEIAAPAALLEVCPSEQPFSAAFLLAPPGLTGNPVCTLRLMVSAEPSEWPELPSGLRGSFGSNMSARLLPVLAGIASLQSGGHLNSLRFPISTFSSLTVTLGD